MRKGCMFVVTLILGVLSNNAAFADNDMPDGNIQAYGDYDNRGDFGGGRFDNRGDFGGGRFDNRGDFGRMRHISEVGSGNNGYYNEGEVEPDCEYRSGPCVCYCPVTKFKPCYYTCKRCVQEPYCEYKRCCRMVPQYYEKQCCRMVPQYYCKTCCKQVPEYYCVPVQKCRTRVICERKCRYVPCTYMKKTCVDCPPSCPSPCAPASECAGGMCGSR